MTDLGPRETGAGDEHGPLQKAADASTGRQEHGIGDHAHRVKDTAYSPSSDAETEAAQDLQRDDADLAEDGIDPSKVVTAPGTGGADDVGDVEPEAGDIHLPFQASDNGAGDNTTGPR
ncbi:hypothetical protein DEI81_10050 [Curtobacterium sp. MCBD17_013]|uniref:hypothetical protein n=1 Tax=Curtobacterium sp. MCBD17_013 TaxID=2175668 RepID=UPI000DA961BA|nr:hypothetical protein [Curtobacterium sp. MCBD17_013]PZF61736.1 hypothetical protein DEI81_10050 [Curtobacterium sp. MCBD17_013]